MPIPEPGAAEDPIIRLYDYYYSAADVVYEEVKKLWTEYIYKHRLSPSKTIKFQRLVPIWLGMLYVTLEGFENSKIRTYFLDLNTEDVDLRMRWSTVQHQIGQLGSELKDYRNVTFHFQESMTRLEAKRLEFLFHSGPRSPLDWARELHEEMEAFFNAYRVEAAVRLALSKPKLDDA